MELLICGECTTEIIEAESVCNTVRQFTGSGCTGPSYNRSALREERLFSRLSNSNAVRGAGN